MSKALANEIAALVARGLKVQRTELAGQDYAVVRDVLAPVPPWDRDSYDIAVAIPAAFEHGAGLDGFYLGLPYQFNSGAHPRVSGESITLLDRQWRLVSWHYPDGKAWSRERGDNLDTHIVHCKGFFANRGAVNEP